MSHCSIIAFRNGLPDTELELKNSWLGHAWIWSAVFDNYIKDPNIPYDNWLMPSRTEALWEAAYKPEIPEFIRAVHASTFDYAIVRQENYDKFIQHLNEFRAWHKNKHYAARTRPASETGEDYVFSHLASYVKFIEENRDAEAIGFHGTSVVENLWYKYVPNEDENVEGTMVAYNLNEDTKHQDAYEIIKETE